MAVNKVFFGAGIQPEWSWLFGDSYRWPIYVIILNNPFITTFSKKSNPGHVLALALHLGVFGAGLYPDGPAHMETSLDGQYKHT